MDTIRDPLLILDAGFRVKSANKAFYETFKTVPEKTESQSIYNIGSGCWNIQALRALLEEVIPGNAVVEGFILECDFNDAGHGNMRLNARRIGHRPGMPELILIVFDMIPHGVDK